MKNNKLLLSYSIGHLVRDSDSIGVIAEGKLIDINLDMGVMGGANNMNPFNASDMTGKECFEERKCGTPGTEKVWNSRNILVLIYFEFVVENKNKKICT